MKEVWPPSLSVSLIEKVWPQILSVALSEGVVASEFVSLCEGGVASESISLSERGVTSEISITVVITRVSSQYPSLIYSNLIYLFTYPMKGVTSAERSYSFA